MTVAWVARPDCLPVASERLVVVEASAGTGKTFFLEHRVIDLILGADAELGQILLVTFTDKAVAELRMRIRDLLDRLSRATGGEPGPGMWQIDDAARAKLRAALTAFDHAPIYTIHGFCQRILVEDAFAARRLFEQTQIADEDAFDTAFYALIRERFARISPDRDLLGAYLEAKTIDQLRELLLACARADARPLRPFDAARIEAIVGQLRGSLGSDPQRAAMVSAVARNANETKWIKGWLGGLAEVLARAPVDGPAGRLLGALDPWREAAAKLVKYVKRTDAGLASAIAEIASLVSIEQAIAAELLPPILARIGADKAERGLFDYDDMLDLVWEALRGPRKDELAARLRTRTPWVMIDEFQDTDPTQWQIFHAVWMNAGRGLTIVGDPKQAIYGFRGADVATYEAARDELLLAGAARVSLTVNRRSTPPLVEAINQLLVGNPLMPMLDKSIRYDEPVSAAGEVVCDDARPPVTALTFAYDPRDKLTADDVRATLSDAIGREIERLRDQPPVWRNRFGLQPFALGQVMVLTRANSESSSIAAALRARGLACALVESDHLFDTREAAELRAVLAAIAAPRDRSARMRALRTRFFDVAWGDLMQVVDAPDHHPLIARLFEWSSLASRRAYERLFRAVVEDSRFAERTLALGAGERAVTNTWHLIEILLREVSRARCDLHELVVQLQRWITDVKGARDERDVQRAETDAEAVRILTIHRAKGLEAPYVFLFGGVHKGSTRSVRTLRDGASRAFVVGSAQEEALLRQLEDDAEGENQRLAYVALTRAQVRLYLPRYPEGSCESGAAYHPIQRCLAPLVTRTPALFEAVAVAVAGDPEPAPLDALAEFAAPAAPAPAAIGELRAARAGFAMLSYTRLAHDATIAALDSVIGGAPLALDPAEFDTEADAELDAGLARDELAPDELPPGAAAGLMLHDVLEVADLVTARGSELATWLADAIVHAQLATAARDRGIPERCVRHAASIVHRTLTAPLALTDGGTLPALAEAHALAREVEFAFPVGRVAATGHAQALVKGFIDALVVYDDELWVLDYKSDFLGSEDLLRAASLRVDERYAVQARLYSIAADRLRGDRAFAGLLFAFIRHDVVVPIRVTAELLTTWSAWLDGLVAGREGRR